jgi:hypothetical protein
MFRTLCLALLVALAGCGTTGNDHTCANPVDGPDPCPARCPGDCVPFEPGKDGFHDRPALVWSGLSTEERPDCPDPLSTYWDAYADLVTPPFCPTCRCDAPSGSCELPTELRAHAAPCGSGGFETSLDPPTSWTGSCSADTGIDPGQKCNGDDCLQSVTIGALKLAETECQAVSGVSGERTHSWATVARICKAEAHPGCPDDAHFCAPKAPNGFRHCILSDQIAACPKEYPVAQQQFFQDDSSDDIQDDRGCNPCTCADPAGGSCISRFRFYSDNMCAKEIYYQDASSDGSVCHDIMPAGLGLLSKQAEPPTYIPGECAPIGGEETGALVPQRPVTICCL